MDLRKSTSLLGLAGTLALSLTTMTGTALADQPVRVVSVGSVVSTTTVVSVPAIALSVDSGLNLVSGSTVQIVGSGIASICGGLCNAGPDGLGQTYDGSGPAPSATTPIGALVYKVGSGPWALAGSSVTVPAGQSGELLFAVQDGINNSDNLGAFTATVTATSGSSVLVPCKPGQGFGNVAAVHCFAQSRNNPAGAPVQGK